MTTPPFSARSTHRSRAEAFSLVEITLALGIMAYAFVATFGLTSFGLQNFRTAIDANLSAQIAQRVIQEAEQTDFNQLVPATGTASVAVQQPIRYFDYQGNEISTPAGALYQVNTRVIPGTTLPGGGAAASINLALVTVQVANNPGNQNLPLSTGAANDPTCPRRDLWQAGTMPMAAFSALVARNG